MVLHPEMLECKNIADGNGDMEKRLGVLKKDLGTVRRRIIKVHELYDDEKIDKNGFSDRYEPLRRQQDAIEEELPRLQAAIDAIEVKRISQEYTIRQAETFSRMWDKLNESQKKQLARKLVSEITVGKEQMTLAFRYMPEFTPPCNWNRTGRGSSPQRA
jgi:hypothetical protein